MRTIGSTTGSATGDALASPSRATAAASTGRSSPSSDLVTTLAATGESPAVVVDLSDSSKAMLERTKIAQAVADKLDERIDALRGNGTHAQVHKSKNVEASAPFVSLSGRSAPQPTQTTWRPVRRMATPPSQTLILLQVVA